MATAKIHDLEREIGDLLDSLDYDGMTPEQEALITATLEHTLDLLAAMPTRPAED